MAITGPSGTYLQATPGIGPYPNRTIAAWIKQAASATATNYFFNVTGPANNYQCNLHGAGTPTPNSGGSVSQSPSGQTIDCPLVGVVTNPTGWHLYLATHDNGGTAGQVKTVTMYLDGVQNNSTTAGGPVTGMVDNDPASTDFVFTGSVDGNGTIAYPMLWKRLLSPAEITALYNGGAGADPRVVAGSQLVIFAQLNSASGPITDLATPSIQWAKVGSGTFTVVADPFTLAPASQPSGQPFPPAWERGAGAADPGLSLINGPYSGPQAAGSGYARIH